nr:MAG TPA: hypothetical protein [Caudoviricetes sp.]
MCLVGICTLHNNTILCCLLKRLPIPPQARVSQKDISKRLTSSSLSANLLVVSEDFTTSYQSSPNS